MSKIGKKGVAVPGGVSVTQSQNVLSVTGPKGAVFVHILPGIAAEIRETEIRCTAADNAIQTRANWGTTRALIQNAINGVVAGHSKKLEIEGVGFRVVAKSPRELNFQLGFTRPIVFPLPENITATIVENGITIFGADRRLVGQVAADIRALRKPEPYKGKGIRYAGEVIRRKEGKKAA